MHEQHGRAFPRCLSLTKTMVSSGPVDQPHTDRMASRCANGRHTACALVVPLQTCWLPQNVCQVCAARSLPSVMNPVLVRGYKISVSAGAVKIDCEQVEYVCHIGLSVVATAAGVDMMMTALRNSIENWIELAHALNYQVECAATDPLGRRRRR